MNLPGSLVVARRVLTQIRRDRRTLVMIILQPIIIMAVFGYALGGDVSDARVGVANLDRGSLGAKVIDHLDLSVVVLIHYATGADAEQALLTGAVSMAVVIPSNFTRNFESSATGDPRSMIIEVYKDNTNVQVTAAALSELGDALRDALEAETDRPPAFTFDERVVYGEEDARALDFFVPGVAAFAIFQLGSLLTVITIVKERTLGTLPRVMASPIKRWEVVLGYTTAFTVLSIVQAASILLVATLVFSVDIRGSFLLALGAATLVGIVALGFGILISGIAQSEFQAVQSVFLFSFPMLFLSGVFAPAEAMPPFLRPIMRLIPLSYAVDALRGIIAHGRTLTEVAPSLLALVGFAAVSLAIATATFGRKA